MATRVIMIEFNPEATSTQMEVFEEELKAVAGWIDSAVLQEIDSGLRC